MSDVFNEIFQEIIPDGAPGNQAYRGIFYRNRQGLFRRLHQAEGHEIAKNAEVDTRNTIGMTQPRDVIRSYRETFDKHILITKGEENHEFFNDFNTNEYKGKNAELDMLMIDFMVSTPRNKTTGDRVQIYKAYAYTCTVTVTTVNNTDATLSISFGQAGNRMSGTATYDDDTKTAVFTPSNDITISTIVLSDNELDLAVGEEKWVSVDFEPFGAPDVFTQSSSDTDICTAEAKRGSVIVTGVGSGTATVTVKDAATEAITATIEVIVS